MKIELNALLEETLKKYRKIKFDLTYVNKGCIVELEIGDKKNEECGSIYDELSEWLSYGGFLDYLIKHNVFHNFSGEFLFENKEIFILITLIGSCWEIEDDPNIKHLYLSKEFVTDDLKIDLNELKIPAFDEDKFSLCFFKRKDSQLEKLELNYFDDEWKNYTLNEQQFKILKEHVDSVIISSIPIYEIDFDHEVIWEVNCDDWYLDFNYWTTPIRISLNDVLSA